MSRRKAKGRPVSGWLVLDKAYDLGSTEAVSKAKQLFQAQKVGHAGTLDPLATGILPLAFGEATKTVPFVMESKKRYRFTVRWGVATSTDDVEGEVIATSQHRPAREAIDAGLEHFVGEIFQIPPSFSAVKVDGERAYDIAREGHAVELAPRRVNIYDFTCINAPDADHADFEATTGKGAYIRALVRDFAHMLGTQAHVSTLRRLSVGPFGVEDSVTLAELEKMGGPEARDGVLLPIGAALADLPKASIGGPEAERLRRGQPALLSPATARGLRAGEAGLLPAVFASENGEAVAICELDGLKLKPLRVFNS